MTAEYRGKVVCVTGAASGIGLATARAFAQEEASLVVADISKDKLIELADHLTKTTNADVRPCPSDLAKPADVERLAATVLDAHGRIDVLVNNAGIAFMGTALETTSEEWDRVFAINVRAAFLLSRALLPSLIENGGGSIVNTASEAGLVGFLGYAAYSASKAALVNLTRSMALDHAAHKVRINCVCPGSIETPLLTEYYDSMPDPRKAREEDEIAHPLGIGSPEDIANGILFLSSDRANYITGHALVIDGGYTIG